MKTTARRHHYLPQAYLAAFTGTGTKDGQFYVLDTINDTRFCTSPINVAVERDFNRFDIEGEPPDFFEKTFSDFEERAIQAIKNVNKNKTFPSYENFNYILNLICLIAVRNPQLRKSFNKARELSSHIVGNLLFSDKKIWDHHLKKAQEAGYIADIVVSFEDIKRFFKKRRYKIEFSPGSNLQIELQSFDKLLILLGQRIWSLLIAPSHGTNFICSDHPVTLTWKNPDINGPIGYGLRNTEVFFPLGPEIGFYGVYEETLRTIVNLNPAQVAKMNTRIANNAERHVFSPKDTFLVWQMGEIRELKCGSNLPSNEW